MKFRQFFITLQNAKDKINGTPSYEPIYKQKIVI